MSLVFPPTPVSRDMQEQCEGRQSAQPWTLWLLLAPFALAPHALAADANSPCSSSVALEYRTSVGKIQTNRVKNLVANGEPSSFEFPDFLHHFRVRLKVTEPMPSDWRLSIYGEKEAAWQALQIFGPKNFEQSKTVWSKRFDGKKIKTILYTSLPHDAGSFLKIDAAISVPRESNVAHYSVENTADLKWQCLGCPLRQEHLQLCQKDKIDCKEVSPKTVRLGEGVGMVMVFGSTAAWTCSGFMISPELFLTNWHCGGTKADEANYWDADILRTALIDFSWDGDDLSSEYGWSGKPAFEGKNVVMDRDLDYAIFRVKPWLQSIGPPPIMPIKAGAVLKDEETRLQIIHHPLSRVKTLTQKNCKVEKSSYHSWMTKVDDVDFLHKCDTEGGSSGAPVFDEAGFVIGIHHSGHSQTENGICDQNNKAVKIDRVLDNLPSALKDEIMRWQTTF